MINNTQLSLNILDDKGNLELPHREEIAELIGSDYMETAERMWYAIWQAYLKNKGTTSTPYWANKFNNAVVFHKLLEFLDQTGWVRTVTIPNKNWSEVGIIEDKLLQYLTSEKLTSIRAQFKFSKYFLTNTTPKYMDKTSVRGKKKHTGLVREGFFKAGHTKFQFDVDMMQEHYDVIIEEAIKSMVKVRLEHPDMEQDEASYDEIVKTCIDYLIKHNGTYTPGQSHMDTRGRDIAGYLAKIFNPVAFKMARALLVINVDDRNPATRNGLKNKYLFIAELMGFKSGTVQEKADMGRDCYYRRTYHNLDWTTDSKIAQIQADTKLDQPAKDAKIQDVINHAEKQRAEQHENIWLERVYEDIDGYLQPSMTTRAKREQYSNNEDVPFAELKKLMEAKTNSEYKWVVPIEIDMSASVLGFLGLLMNHEPFMERCNMLGDYLTDAWDVKGISTRAQAKSIMKTVYGSSQSCIDDWTEQKLKFTPEDVAAYEYALEHGEIAVGKFFRDLIVENCNPQEKMTLHIWNEKVEVECNKFQYVGDKLTIYDLFDSITGTPQRIAHTDTVSIPDLDQFRLFFITALI